MVKRNKMLPHVEVSRKEFIKLFVESGGDEDKALVKAMVTEGLNNYTLIGDKMVKSLGAKDACEKT